MTRHAEQGTGRGKTQELYNVGSKLHALHFRPIKQQITLRVDSDVIAWFRANHPRYQTLMNAVLRKEMTHALTEEQYDRQERAGNAQG